MRMTQHIHSRQARAMRGSSLMEVLVSILILSFGLLAMGSMMAHAVQLPKLSGNRAVASNIATDLVERMRANAPEFNSGTYDTALNYDGSLAVPTTFSVTCSYPNCTSSQIATSDVEGVFKRVRQTLPAGGISITRTGTDQGQVYVLWQEAALGGSFATAASDICPTLTAKLQDPQPRCLMVPFKL